MQSKMKTLFNELNEDVIQRTKVLFVALEVQKSKNFCSENDTSLSHLQQVHKGNKSLAIRKAVHLKPNSSQLPAKSPITEANTVSHGRLRLCNRRYGGANSSWRWDARDTRGEEYFRFQVIFLFSLLSRVAMQTRISALDNACYVGYAYLLL